MARKLIGIALVVFGVIWFILGWSTLLEIGFSVPVLIQFVCIVGGLSMALGNKKDKNNEEEDD